MPCFDGRERPGYDSGYADGRGELRRVEAMLCAALRVIDKHGLGKEIDYKEGGFGNADLQRWWANHQRQDALRLERERRIAREKAEKEAILRKLTPLERKKLGL